MIRNSTSVLGSMLIIASLTISCSKGFFGNFEISSSAEVEFKGMVSLGPVHQALIKAYEINPDGSRGAELGSAITDNQGKYILKFIRKSIKSIEVVAIGGVYIEEASGDSVSLEGKELVSIIDNVDEKKEVAITALTDIAAKRAKQLNSSGIKLQDAILAAQSEVQEAAGVHDIYNIPANPTSNSDILESSEKARYALVLAGISKMAKDRNVDSHQLTLALAKDFNGDAKFNGEEAGHPVAVEQSGLILSGKEWSDDLNKGMNDFIADSSRNPGAFSSQQIPTVISEPVNRQPVSQTPARISIPLASQFQLLMPSFAIQGHCLPIVIKSVDSEGRTAQLQNDVILNVSNSKGQFFRNANCSNGENINQLEIKSGNAISQIFVKFNSSGAALIQLIDPSETLISMGKTVEVRSSSGSNISSIDLDIERYMIFMPSVLNQNEDLCIPVRVQPINAIGIIIPTITENILQVSILDAVNNQQVLGSSSVSVYNDSACLSSVNSIVISSNQILKDFFIKTKLSGKFKLRLSNSQIITEKSFEVLPGYSVENSDLGHSDVCFNSTECSKTSAGVHTASISRKDAESNCNLNMRNNPNTKIICCYNGEIYKSQNLESYPIASPTITPSPILSPSPITTPNPSPIVKPSPTVTPSPMPSAAPSPTGTINQANHFNIESLNEQNNLNLVENICVGIVVKIHDQNNQAVLLAEGTVLDIELPPDIGVYLNSNCSGEASNSAARDSLLGYMARAYAGDISGANLGYQFYLKTNSNYIHSPQHRIRVRQVNYSQHTVQMGELVISSYQVNSGASTQPVLLDPLNLNSRLKVLYIQNNFSSYPVLNFNSENQCIMMELIAEDSAGAQIQNISNTNIMFAKIYVTAGYELHSNSTCNASSGGQALYSQFDGMYHKYQIPLLNSSPLRIYVKKIPSSTSMSSYNGGLDVLEMRLANSDGLNIGIGTSVMISPN